MSGVRCGSYGAKRVFSAIAPPSGASGSIFAPEVLAEFWTSPENGNPPLCTV